jgi:hypothetical protein
MKENSHFYKCFVECWSERNLQDYYYYACTYIATDLSPDIINDVWHVDKKCVSTEKRQSSILTNLKCTEERGMYFWQSRNDQVCDIL